MDSDSRASFAWGMNQVEFDPCLPLDPPKVVSHHDEKDAAHFVDQWIGAANLRDV